MYCITRVELRHKSFLILFGLCLCVCDVGWHGCHCLEPTISLLSVETFMEMTIDFRSSADVARVFKRVSAPTDPAHGLPR